MQMPCQFAQTRTNSGSALLCSVPPLCSCACLPCRAAHHIQFGTPWDGEGCMRNRCESRGGNIRLEIQCNARRDSRHPSIVGGGGSRTQHCPLHAHDGECKYTHTQWDQINQWRALQSLLGGSHIIFQTNCGFEFSIKVEKVCRQRQRRRRVACIN